MAAPNDKWAGDRLDRKQDAEFLYNFLIGQIEKRKTQGRIASYVLNVDADWGGGKSFFLDGLAQDIEVRGHLVARINAWQDDHAADPYIAIMAAIDKTFQPFVKKPGKIQKTWDATKASGGPIALRIGGAILKGMMKRHVGIDFEEVVGMIGEDGELSDLTETAISEGIDAAGTEINKLFDASLDALIKGFQKTDKAMVDFRTKLAAAINSVSNKRTLPFFVLIDELDRCRPTYAVALLERVKHLFEVDGIVFVFATNSDQLQHSIAGAYGVNFNGFRYLKRFFDRTYVFEEPSIRELVSNLSEILPRNKIRAPDDDLVQALTLGCKAYGFDLRAITQVLEMIDAAASAWPHKIPADIVLLFPLCAHFYKTGKIEWPSHQAPEITSWTWLRSREDPFERKSVDTSFYYGRAYHAGIAEFRSMEQLMNFRHDNISTEYMYNTFNPEWNDVPVNRKQASIQTELLGLVAKAGRIVSKRSAVPDGDS
ncbi:KAP family P-loop NTPase fold protein [Rhizobium leguminosarum]|uniref:KAP family P-loop NTPase fold protein n=1 Tax=Rhizobium leguminosarum TaxID=384 RepID=UPI0013DCEE80|nr:P-loop NTPase fold protein [Rhizobium leguminosarum]NEK35534.1 hypothetical protein [Rhizobium leguminosarum]